MGLYEKIMAIYPNLTEDQFNGFDPVILLRNDSDGRGDYIAKWEHPTLTKPTDEQLAAVEGA